MRFHSLPCSLLALACALPAADDGTTDLRLRVGLVPGVGEVQSDSSAGGRSTTSVDDQGGINVAPTLVWSMGSGQVGMVVGTGLFWREHEWTYEDVSGAMEGTGISLLAGAYFRPSPQFQIELTPFVEFGIAEETYQPNDSEGGMDNGLYFAYGVQAGAWYALSGGLLVGAEVGYTAGEGESSYTDTFGNDNEWTLEFSGLSANLGLGYRF